VPRQKFVRSWRGFRVSTSTRLVPPLQFINHTILRRPLGEIDPNRVSGTELSTRIRDRIAGVAACGMGSSTISKVFKIPESIIRKTVKLDLIR
jgi:hypothetical protein